MRARRPSTAASSTRTLADVGTETPKRGGRRALVVLEQGRQDMLDIQRRALGVGRDALGGQDGLLRLLGVAWSGSWSGGSGCWIGGGGTTGRTGSGPPIRGSGCLDGGVKARRRRGRRRRGRSAGRRGRGRRDRRRLRLEVGHAASSQADDRGCFWVSGGMRRSTLPLSVSTGTSAPSNASSSRMGSSRCRSSPLRVKTWCCAMRMRR